MAAIQSKLVPVEKLLLDPNNYRIKNDALYRFVKPAEYANDDVQLRTLTIVSGDKNVQIQDLIGSFEHNGFLPIDQIQVRPYDNDGNRFLVLEGNRRVAALKRMRMAYQTSGATLGALDPAIFDAVPVVVFDVASDVDAMVLMGLKHISGNKKWSDYNQAIYVYDLFARQGLEKDRICERIAVSKVAVGTFIRTVSLINQYRESDYGDQFVESMFPLFKEIVQNRKLREYVGWNESALRAESESNVSTIFSLISHDTEDDSDADATVEREPAITKRNELRQLAEMIDDSAAVGYLLKTRDLMSAYSRSAAVAHDQTRNLIESLELDARAFKSFRVDANGLTRLNSVREQLAEVIADNENQLPADGKRESFLGQTGDGLVLQSLDVQEYKALTGFSMHGFSQVNVIAGANNTGKSTLLEVVNLLIAQADVKTVFNLMDKRGKHFSEREGYGWSVAQIPEFDIKGVCAGQMGSIVLEKGVESDVQDPDYLTTIEIVSSYNGERQQASASVYRGRIARELRFTKSICPVIFNTPFFNNEQANYRRYYLRCKENKSIDKIILFIREHILADVEEIYWNDEARRFMVSDKSKPTAVDLSQYGEGMQRVFLLALLFASAANGVVLVDELENAIHPRLLVEFTRLVSQLAFEFSVQVFATTHSKECIDGFVAECRASRHDRFTFIGLVTDPEAGRQARVFSGAQYVQACDVADVDLRGVV